jgi:sugar phosphate isomerase/epimerase
MFNKGMIGIQMSTIKKKVEEIGAYETMRVCAEMGYHCIELSQIPMTEENVTEFKRAKDDFDITICAMNASMTSLFPGAESLESNYEKIISDCETLDCRILRIGSGPMNQLNSREGVLQYCEEIEKFVSKLKEDGIDYYYHNHATEFAKFDGEYILDILKNNTSIGFELDTHWIQAGGENPVEIIKRYSGRIRLLHLKDYRIVPIKVDYSRFRNRRAEDSKTSPDTTTTPAAPRINPQYTSIQFAELGEGNLDIRGCIEAGLAGGCEYFLIEQDSTYERDPFESIKISRDHLISLGYADWFE